MQLMSSSGMAFVRDRPFSDQVMRLKRYVVAGVSEGRSEAGVDPNGVDPQRFDVIQLVDDSLDIPYAVAVRVVKALGIDLVE